MRTLFALRCMAIGRPSLRWLPALTRPVRRLVLRHHPQHRPPLAAPDARLPGPGQHRARQDRV